MIDSHSAVTPRSRNRKVTADADLRAVTVTRASRRDTCPARCPLYAGCYGATGKAGMHARRLEQGAPMRPEAVAAQEGRALFAHWPRDGRPARLHETGDCRTRRAARTLAGWVGRAQAGGAGPAWTYTHAHYPVAGPVRRSDWGPVSVLASVETAEQAATAHAHGWAVALVCESHDQARDQLEAVGLRGFACPQQTGAAPDCASCGACFDDHRLHGAGLVLTLEAHSAGRGRVLEAIAVAKGGK